MLRTLLLAAVAAAVACDRGPLVLVDAPTRPDGRPDGRPRDALTGDGPCGSDAPFAARLVDFDFTDATPTAVAGATFTVQSQPTITGASAADGLVEMCAPVEVDWFQKLDVEAPDAYLDGVVIAHRWATAKYQPPMLLRAITGDRAAAFYSAQLGVGFDATRAHVIVLNACDRVEPALDRPHGTALAGSEEQNHGIAWSAGTIGDYILFPNVDVTQPTGVVSWGYGGPLVVPLPAGEWTMVVDCVVFL